jgi:hypothetical protein
VIVLALPVFAVAGWPLSGWTFAAVLWVARSGLRLATDATLPGRGNLAAQACGASARASRRCAVVIPARRGHRLGRAVGVCRRAPPTAFAFTGRAGRSHGPTSREAKA